MEQLTEMTATRYELKLIRNSAGGSGSKLIVTRRKNEKKKKADAPARDSSRFSKPMSQEKKNLSANSFFLFFLRFPFFHDKKKKTIQGNLQMSSVRVATPFGVSVRNIERRR